MIYDKGVKAAGILVGIIESLHEKGIDFQEYDGVLPNPPDYQVQEAADLAKKFNAQAIVAVGGSFMDTAKAVNVLLSNPAPINQYDGMLLDGKRYHRHRIAHYRRHQPLNYPLHLT